MTEDPRSIALGLQPNFITFNILLKSLAKSNRPDVGKRAIEILDELDRRYRSGDANCRPTENTFNSAILACLHGGNCELAETVMDRMNKMGLSPSLKTYNDIMSHWAKIGTRASAERTEQILAKMKQIAKSRPDLAPDAVSYNIVLSAWARASCPLSAKKMWMLYEEMLNAKIEPDMAAMNTLICFFSKSKVRAIIQKADDLLVIMEKSSKRTLSPDFRHFVPVIQGWLSIGDVDSAAATLVRRVEAFMSETGTKDASPNAAPNSIIIDQIVHGYLRQGHLEKAMSFLEKFKQLKDESSLPEGPCVRSFTSLLSNWEKSSHPNKAFAITKLRGIIANWNASSLNA
jgi:pentatricopeptide repeat protein